MYRLSLIISEIYNKYLPLAEKDGIILNLDLSDTTKEIADPERVKKFLDEHLNSTLKRSDKGEVTIGVDKNAITITDTATTLSHAACALLSNRYIDVASRVGFGTTVKIFFKPRELTPTAAKSPTPTKVEGVSFDVTANNDLKKPTLETTAKIATSKGKRKVGFGAKLKLTGKTKAKKSTTKPSTSPKNKTTRKLTAKPKNKLQTARTKRRLEAAAKKADKEVKRIAKKASKQNRKLAKKSKTTSKSSSTKSNSAASTIKKPSRKVRKLKLT